MRGHSIPVKALLEEVDVTAHVATGDIAYVHRKPVRDIGGLPARGWLDALVAFGRVAFDELVAKGGVSMVISHAQRHHDRTYIFSISSLYARSASLRMTVPFSVRGRGLSGRVTRINSLKMRL